MGSIVSGIGGALGAVGGAITGFQGKKSSSSNRSGIDLADAKQRELDAFSTQDRSLGNLSYLVNNGPNAQDYSAGVNSSRDLADLLKQYQSSAGLPNQGDINQANDISNNLFAARDVALRQSFEDQNTEAQRLSARLGRPVNDPILQAKLRTGFIRQQDLLNADKSAASQNLALQLPGQRLNFASQRSNVLNALGGQAMQNQNFLLGLGNSIGNQERNFRLQTGEHWSNGTQKSGGGIGDAIAGGIGGLGAGIGAGNAINGLMASNPFSSPTLTSGSSSGFNLGVGSSYNLGGSFTPTMQPMFTGGASTFGGGFSAPVPTASTFSAPSPFSTNMNQFMHQPSIRPFS